jgi:hypothetical protein
MTAFVGALRQYRLANDRIIRSDQHSVLRGDGAPDSLVAVQWLPDDFVYAVVHHSRRVWHCTGVRTPGANTAPWFVARRRSRWLGWRSIRFWLLRGGVSDYRPTGQGIERGKIIISASHRFAFTCSD